MICTVEGCTDPHLAKGLCRKHYKRMRDGRPLVSIERGEKSGHGLHGILEENGALVKCHECGQWVDFLGNHSQYVHGLPAREYKIKHGLPVSRGLLSRQARQEKRTETLANTAAMSALDRHRDPAKAAAARDGDAFMLQSVSQRVAKARGVLAERGTQTLRVYGALTRETGVEGAAVAVGVDPARAAHIVARRVEAARAVKACHVPGCEQDMRAVGLCRSHYRRWIAGRPLLGAEGAIPAGYGTYGVLTERDGEVKCHECAAWMRAITPGHLRTHSMTVAVYREKYGLGSRALVSEQTKRAASRAGRKGYEASKFAVEP